VEHYGGGRASRGLSDLAAFLDEIELILVATGASGSAQRVGNGKIQHLHPVLGSTTRSCSRSDGTVSAAHRFTRGRRYVMSRRRMSHGAWTLALSVAALPLSSNPATQAQQGAQQPDQRVRACGRIVNVSCDGEKSSVSVLLNVDAPDVLLVHTDAVPDRAVRHLMPGQRVCFAGRLTRKGTEFALALFEADAMSGVQPGKPLSDQLGPGVYSTCDPDVQLPTVVREVQPNYTADAIRAHVQGTVWVEVLVDTNGKVAKAWVLRSLDRRTGLDNEAVVAAKRWRFNPATKGSQAVPMVVTIELSFTLRPPH